MEEEEPKYFGCKWEVLARFVAGDGFGRHFGKGCFSGIEVDGTGGAVGEQVTPPSFVVQSPAFPCQGTPLLRLHRALGS